MCYQIPLDIMGELSVTISHRIKLLHIWHVLELDVILKASKKLLMISPNIQYICYTYIGKIFQAAHLKKA